MLRLKTSRRSCLYVIIRRSCLYVIVRDIEENNIYHMHSLKNATRQRHLQLVFHFSQGWQDESNRGIEKGYICVVLNLKTQLRVCCWIESGSTQWLQPVYDLGRINFQPNMHPNQYHFLIKLPILPQYFHACNEAKCALFAGWLFTQKCLPKPVLILD